MVKIQCRSCSKAVGVDNSLRGKQIQCPHCGAANKVPTKKSTRTAEPPAPAEPSVELPVAGQPDSAEQAAGTPSLEAAPDVHIAVKKASASRSPRRRTPKKRAANPGLMLAGSSALLLVIIGIVAWIYLGNRTATQVAGGTAPSEPTGTEQVARSGSPPDASFESESSQPPGDGRIEEIKEIEEQDAVDAVAETTVTEAPIASESPQEPAIVQPVESQTPIPGTDEEAGADQLAPNSGLPHVEFTQQPPDATAPGGLPEFSTSGLTASDVQKLGELYDNRSLFSVKEHATLRQMFADRFERSYAAEIKSAWGTEDEAFRDWLDQNRVLKEELFLAIDPHTDDVVRSLELFKTLKETFPEHVAAYGNLAIATAVTWDKPRSIYDYGQHQRRAKAEMPDGLTDAIANFDYFLKTEEFMQGRGQWLPWEFLAHVVNHQTPLAERAWALQNYLPSRVMFGKCYHDVPYDNLMLETGSEQARMNGQPYTLANLRTFGGVCALQADFASRVGQSLGVPAAYVGGESTFGGSHAWVMWVELKTVTPKSIVFSLESYGRYRGDKYYVGTLRDPKSGQTITDRQLELRLHTVGIDPVAKRHADLVMAAFPALKDDRDFGINDQFGYMSRTIELCPGNEQAWVSLSQMASNEEVKDKHRKQMTAILNQLFTTFANFPDFTWTIFDDLIQYEDQRKERIKLYERLTLLYQAAQRPDLACEARLRLTDLLVEDERELEAIEGLAATIYAFVDEGRYVPKMLDRIELICRNVEGATPNLLRFYNAFLPRIPQMRGDRPSPYCMDMFQRAIALFKQHGEPAAAQMYEAQLAEIRAGRGRRESSR